MQTKPRFNLLWASLLLLLLLCFLQAAYAPLRADTFGLPGLTATPEEVNRVCDGVSVNCTAFNLSRLVNGGDAGLLHTHAIDANGVAIWDADGLLPNLRLQSTVELTTHKDANSGYAGLSAGGKLSFAQMSAGDANGMARLDANSHLRSDEMPTGFELLANKDANSGYAGLSAGGKLSFAQMSAGDANGMARLDANSHLRTDEMPTGFELLANKDANSGYAGLGANGRMSASELPTTAVVTGMANAASGYAGLDANTQLSFALLPLTATAAEIDRVCDGADANATAANLNALVDGGPAAALHSHDVAVNGVAVRHASGLTTIYTASADTDVARGTALATAWTARATGDTFFLGAYTYDLVSTQLARDDTKRVAIDGVGSGFSIITSANAESPLDVSAGMVLRDLALIGTAAGATTDSGSTGLIRKTGVSVAMEVNVFRCAITGQWNGVWWHAPGTAAATLNIYDSTINGRWTGVECGSHLSANNFYSIANVIDCNTTATALVTDGLSDRLGKVTNTTADGNTLVVKNFGANDVVKAGYTFMIAGDANTTYTEANTVTMSGTGTGTLVFSPPLVMSAAQNAVITLNDRITAGAVNGSLAEGIDHTGAYAQGGTLTIRGGKVSVAGPYGGRVEGNNTVTSCLSGTLQAYGVELACATAGQHKTEARENYSGYLYLHACRHAYNLFAGDWLDANMPAASTTDSIKPVPGLVPGGVERSATDPMDRGDYSDPEDSTPPSSTWLPAGHLLTYEGEFFRVIEPHFTSTEWPGTIYERLGTSSLCLRVAAAGSDQAGAAQLRRGYTVVCGATGSNGVKLSASMDMGLRHTVKNDANSALLVYPGVDHKIENLSANAAGTIAAHSTVVFTGIAPTALGYCGCSYAGSTGRLTSGTVANRTLMPGDQVHLTAGTNITPGWYAIDLDQSTTTYVHLASSPLTAGDPAEQSPADVFADYIGAPFVWMTDPDLGSR